MGRAPCCDKSNVKRGPWSPEEDQALKNYLESHGTGGNWIALPQKAGLKRCGKSCRLRWLNYLRPDIKHGGFTEEEDKIICSLYISIGSRWSVIAAKLPGRTDNDVKNYWNTKLKKKFLAGKLNSSSSPSPSLPTKSEFENPSVNRNSSALPLPMDIDFRQNIESQRLVSDPIHELSSTTNYQEVSGVSYSSSVQSSLSFENNYNFWSGNGSGGDQDDGFFMDFGFNPSSYDFVHDFGFQYQDQKTSETVAVVAAAAAASSNSANTSTLLYANYLASNSTTSDAKSQQGLYQSVRN